MIRGQIQIRCDRCWAEGELDIDNMAELTTGLGNWSINFYCYKDGGYRYVDFCNDCANEYWKKFFLTLPSKEDEEDFWSK